MMKTFGIRLKFSMKALWRDKGSKYSLFMGVYFGALWLFNKKIDDLSKETAKQDSTGKNTQNNGAFTLNLLLGIYFGGVLSCNVRLGLLEYFEEKKNKMLGFLKNLGITSFTYFCFHAIKNWIVGFIITIPFLAIFSFSAPEANDSFPVILFLVFLGSLSNSVYTLFFARFFSTAVSGLATIGTVNFILASASSVVKANSVAYYLISFCPQSQLVFYATDLLAPSPRASYLFYVAYFLLSTLAYAVLMVISHKMLKNEFGFYSNDSWCKKKAHKKSQIKANPGDSYISEIGVNLKERDSDNYQDDDLSQKESLQGDQRFETDSASNHCFETSSDIVFKIMNIQKSFGTNKVLENINIDISKGEMVCLLGANGAGKSTLFNIMLDNIEQDSGQILQGGSKEISFCPQQDMGWDCLTIEEHFELIMLLQGDKINPIRKQEIITKVKNITLLESHWKVIFKELSGGYKRRMTIALSLLTQSPLLVLDEPTTSLDIDIRYNLMKNLSSARKELGTTIMYTTHHLEDAENFSDKILILSKGKIILRGTIEELRTKFNLTTFKLYGETKDLESKMPSIRKKLDSLIMDNIDMTMIDSSGPTVSHSSCLTFKAPVAQSALLSLTKFLEDDLGLFTELRQTSLEDVYVMDGEFENYGQMEEIGLEDMEECWNLILNSERRSGLFFRSFWTLFVKNFKMFYRSQDLLVKHISLLVTIVIIILLYTSIFESNQEKSDSSKKDDSTDDDNILKHPELSYIFFGFFTLELLMMAPVFTGPILSVKDHESKIYHFLMASWDNKLKKLVYRLSLITLDAVETFILAFFSIYVSKIICTSNFLPSFLDLALSFLMTLHNICKLLCYSIPFSFIFSKKKTLMNFLSLLNMLGYFVVIFITSLSFIFKGQVAVTLNKFLFPKLILNCFLAILPQKYHKFMTFVPDYVEQNGGFWPNFVFLLIHLIAYYLIVAYFEGKKYDVVKKKLRQNDSRDTQVEMIRDRQELFQEKEFVDTQQPQIMIQKVSKTYKNNFTACRDINLGVGKKKILTILGPNGAGKTSLLDVLCGISERNGGDVSFEGYPIESYKSRRISFCFQDNYLWEEITFKEHIEIVGKLKGLSNEVIQKLLKDIDRGLDIHKNMNIRATHLSGGNKRKLNTILALLSAPVIYVLDEPTAGMDPKSRRYFWNILNTWKRSSDCSLILTTHTANEAEVILFNSDSF